VAFQVLLPCGARLRVNVGVITQILQRPAPGVDVSRLRKPSGRTVAQEFRYAADIGGEDRRARRQCFDDDHRLTLEPQRREHEAPDRAEGLEHHLALDSAGEPDTGHAHRLERFALRTVAHHQELAVLQAGEPPGFQEPANAFLTRQPPDVSELTRLRCGYCTLTRVRDAIVPYAQLLFWYSRFDKTGLREFREA
jgi:hypothetical protein